MKNKVRLLVVCLFLIILSASFSQSGEGMNHIQSVRLDDGSLQSGTVLEHRVGEYLILSDRGGNIQYLPDIRIAAIEHDLEAFPGDSHSVFFLKEGLIIRGHLVRYAPDGTIEVQAFGEQRISLPPERVVKVVHIPKPIPEPGSAGPGGNEIRREATVLELELALGEKKSTASSQATDDSRIESLEEEVSELEECLEQTEESNAEQAQSDNQERVETSMEGVESAVSELAALAAACEAGGPTRTKGGSASSVSNRSSLEILNTAIMGPSSLADFPIEDIRTTAEVKIENLKQRASAPAASIDSISLYTEQAVTTERIQEILNDHKRYGIFIRSRISSLSSDLPEETRRSLYEANRLDNALGSSIRNIIPVLNWGSWRQGDRLHAVLTGAGTLIVYLGAYAFAAEYIDSYTGSTELKEVDGTWRTLAPSPNAVDVGFAVIGVTYLYSLARPFLFAHKQNVRLADSLGIETRGPQW
ncbi:MAG: hypothetical protein ACP5IA_03375 [Sediminispirochaetaceae bacterium]